MVDLSHLSIVELAALICDSLRKKGLPTTLSGGACAEIYSACKYVTGDLDFVVNYLWPENDKTIKRVMTALGFVKNGRVFLNDSVPYSVEFPPGPLGVGDDYHITPVLMRLKTGTLSLLSPTDSAKDRLSGYFYGNDAQCLEQAVMICRMNKVNKRDISAWAKKEGQDEKLKVFERKLAQRIGAPPQGIKSAINTKRRNTSANSRKPKR